MPTRNTSVLMQILQVLHQPQSLKTLEDHFKDALLVVAGDGPLIAKQGEQLRLAISTDECAAVLDHLSPHIRIPIESTDEAINALFPERFIEP